jgi:hypothetical protein
MTGPKDTHCALATAPTGIDEAVTGQTSGGALTGSVFSTSEHSADISWLPQEQAARGVAQAAAAEAVPDGRPGPPDAAAEAAGLAEAVGAPALRFAPPGAAPAAAEPGVAVQHVRPVAWASLALPQVSRTAEAAALPFFPDSPGCRALLHGPILSAPPGSFPVFLESPRLRHQTASLPERSSQASSLPICFLG